jgi:hypothetical protein
MARVVQTNCVSMFQCFDVTIFRCFDVTMLRCFDVTMLQCYNVSMFLFGRSYTSPALTNVREKILTHLLDSVDLFVSAVAVQAAQRVKDTNALAATVVQELDEWIGSVVAAVRVVVVSLVVLLWVLLVLWVVLWCCGCCGLPCPKTGITVLLVLIPRISLFLFWLFLFWLFLFWLFLFWLFLFWLFLLMQETASVGHMRKAMMVAIKQSIAMDEGEARPVPRVQMRYEMDEMDEMDEVE